MNKKISTPAAMVLILVILLIVIAAFWWFLHGQKAVSPAAAPSEKKNTEQSQSKEATNPKEKGCLDSGGTAETGTCCQSAGDFPSSCLIGACGCAPANSHQVKTCNCEVGKCFDGNSCVGK